MSASDLQFMASNWARPTRRPIPSIIGVTVLVDEVGRVGSLLMLIEGGEDASEIHVQKNAKTL